MDKLAELREFVQMGAATLSEMPRRTLLDKGIAGPTGAHVIEEIHTPFNLAYVTITTGTSAFQNIVGVTHNEIPDRIAASKKLLELAGVKKQDKLLFTYAPLVNVFPHQALIDCGVDWEFMHSSSRDALILALAETRPQAVIGESSFLRSALIDAAKMGLADLLPRGMVFICAGTPLDLGFLEAAHSINGTVHDAYGCQEFGWLTLDGIELREDIELLESGENYDLIVGGLPTGDCFPVLQSGHLCNPDGKIITYSRIRSGCEPKTTVLQSVAQRQTVERLARTILRIKAKVVQLSPDFVVGDKNIVSINRGTHDFIITKTAMFESLLSAQIAYQAQSKTDPAWIKQR